MAADAAITLGVAASAWVILRTHWEWLNPVVSLIIVFVITISTWDLLRDSFNLAMDAVPEGVSLDRVERFLVSLPGCQGVHDLHIWGMSTSETALTAHLVVKDDELTDRQLAALNDQLHHHFGIEHSTIQLESSAAAALCRGCKTP